MSLNYAEIDKILEELQLSGAFIQKVRQPNFATLLLDIYRPSDSRKLLISLDPKATRLHYTSHNYKSEVKLQRFAQFLRARIDGGRITEARQIGQERIVKLTVTKGDVTTLIFARLWSSNANIIVCDQDFNILDVNYRRPQRDEVSGGVFNPEADDLKPSNKVFTVREHGEQLLNEFVDDFYYQKGYEEKLEQMRANALRNLEKELASTNNAIKEAEATLDNSEDGEGFKHLGDLIKSNIYAIPKAAKEVELDDWETGEKVKITLNPELSLIENADFYYKKSSKLKAKKEFLADELERLFLRKKGIEEQLEAVTETREIALLREILDQIKPAPSTTGKKKEEIVGLQLQSGIFKILVGRNSKENDKLLRSQAKGNDYWFHVRDFPGGYVFVKNQKEKTPPLEVMLDACNLAIHYSKAKSNGEADLYYTQVKYLRRVKDGRQGLVIPTQEKNMHVTYDEMRVKRLLK
ncbi:MAG: NFACT family protein [Spirochaetales bacterium]|nr:NFACT family protein [Spirochaetales bacterium]